MKVTPTINNGGRVSPVWFDPRGICNSHLIPCVYISERMLSIDADAIDDLIAALRDCKGYYEEWKAKQKTNPDPD